MDDIFILEMITGKRRKLSLQIYLAVIGLRKTFHQVNREKFWKIIKKKLYASCNENNTLIEIHTGGYHSRDIIINQGFGLGCTVSPVFLNMNGQFNKRMENKI
jgi:hypothetical protein